MVSACGWDRGRWRRWSGGRMESRWSSAGDRGDERMRVRPSMAPGLRPRKAHWRCSRCSSLVDRGKRSRSGRRRAMTIFCLLVAVAGCGDGSGKRHAEGLLDCLRDSGATVKAMPRPTFPPAIEEYKVTLNSGGFDYAFVDVLRSEAEARRRLRPSASAVRKGRILVGYAGSRAHDAALLESCLRSSAEGGGLRPGALVLRARREAARRSAAIKRRNAAIKRQRSAGYGSFTTPAAITRELERLRRFRRYTLYYAGRRVAGLPLTAVVSVL